MTVGIDLGAVTDYPFNESLDSSIFNSRVSEIETVFQAGTKDIFPRQRVFSGTAGETIAAGDALRLSGSSLMKTDNTTLAGVTNFVGFALEAGNATDTVRYSVDYVFGLTGLTSGDSYYLGTSGSITNTNPNSNQSREIGVALNTTDLKIIDPLNSFYEQGSWTPQITGSTNPPDTITYSNQVGRYVRYGHLCWFSFDIQIDTFTLGSGSGDLHITGLPFTSTNVTGLDQVIPLSSNGIDVDVETTWINGQVTANSNYIRVVENKDNAVASLVSLSDLTTPDFIQATGSYLVDL